MRLHQLEGITPFVSSRIMEHKPREKSVTEWLSAIDDADVSGGEDKKSSTDTEQRPLTALQTRLWTIFKVVPMQRERRLWGCRDIDTQAEASRSRHRTTGYDALLIQRLELAPGGLLDGNVARAATIVVDPCRTARCRPKDWWSIAIGHQYPRRCGGRMIGHVDYVASWRGA
jgi:hypothetical protein